MADRPLISTTSFARVVYFHYTKQNFSKSSNERPGEVFANVFATQQTTFDVIEDAIEAISINKDIGAAAGTFEITLLPTKNWKQLVSPGDWLIIYLYNESTSFSLENKNIALIGSVDRVSRTKQKDEESDKTLVRYRIAGRDFGKVFEETDIFVNPYASVASIPEIASSMLVSKGLQLFGSPSELTLQVADVFLSPTGVNISDLAAPANATAGPPPPPLRQWILPAEMAAMFGSFDGSFRSALNLGGVIPDLPGFTTRVGLKPRENPGLWQYLKLSCNEVVNQLWCDLVRSPDGSVSPGLFLRPYPCSVFFGEKDTIKAPTLIDLTNDDRQTGDLIEISNDQILFSDLGRSDDSNINMVWLDASYLNGIVSQEVFQNVQGTPGQVGLPMYSAEYIARYGLQRFKAEMRFAYAKGSNEQTADIGIYKSFIAYLWDIKAYNRLYESGTIESSGIINARLGAVLRVPEESKSSFEGNDILGAVQALANPASVGNSKTKLFYVEGYTHEWRFPGRWTTNFRVTMGQFESEVTPFVDLSGADDGRNDTDFDNTSLVKTNIPRPKGVTIASSEELGNLIPGGVLA